MFKLSKPELYNLAKLFPFTANQDNNFSSALPFRPVFLFHPLLFPFKRKHPHSAKNKGAKSSSANSKSKNSP